MKTGIGRLLALTGAALFLCLPAQAADTAAMADNAQGYGIKIPFTPSPRTSSYTFTVYDGDVLQLSQTLDIPSPQTVFLPFTCDPAQVKTYTLEVTANVDPLRAGLDRPYTKRITFDASANCGHPGAAGALLAGDGSAASPYLVTNAAQLEHVAQHSGASSTQPAYFRQICDIAYDGTSWPARSISSISYDGDGHLLTGFKPSGGGSVFGDAANLSLSNFGINDFSTSNSPICSSLSNLVLSQCFVQNGTISGQSQNFGPLSAMGSSIKASNCYVYDVSVTGYTNVGGMIGNAIDNLYLENCFTKPVQIVTSKVKSGVAWSAPYSSFNVLNTYWLSGSASYAFTTNTNAGATALSHAQMQQQSSYAGFDFDSVWRWDESLKHPVLRVFDY